MVLWRSDGLKHEALCKVEEFLSRVSRKQLKGIEWAVQACRIIVLGSDGMEGVKHYVVSKAGGSPVQGSEPSLAPAAPAGGSSAGGRTWIVPDPSCTLRV